MDYAAQGRGWQGHISFKKVSLAKDTTLMGILWPFDSLITQVNSLDRDKWLSAVRCLYWISSKGSGYPAYTSTSLCLDSIDRHVFPDTRFMSTSKHEVSLAKKIIFYTVMLLFVTIILEFFLYVFLKIS